MLKKQQRKKNKSLKDEIKIFKCIRHLIYALINVLKEMYWQHDSLNFYYYLFSYLYTHGILLLLVDSFFFVLLNFFFHRLFFMLFTHSELKFYVVCFFFFLYSIGFSVAPQWDWSLIREDNFLFVVVVPSSKEYDGLFKDKTQTWSWKEIYFNHQVCVRIKVQLIWINSQSL